MIGLALWVALWSAPHPPAKPGAEFSVPRGTVPQDVSPDPRPIKDRR